MSPPPPPLGAFWRVISFLYVTQSAGYLGRVTVLLRMTKSLDDHQCKCQFNTRITFLRRLPTYFEGGLATSMALQGLPAGTDWNRLDPTSNHARLLHSTPGAQMLPNIQVNPRHEQPFMLSGDFKHFNPPPRTDSL